MRDGISTKDLSYLLGLAVSSLNEFLAKLEKRGFITREPSEQDKRVMLVKLTDKGRSYTRKPEDEGSDLESVLACLTKEEQAALGASLDKLIAALGEKLGFDEEGLEWLKAASDERDRMFGGPGGMRGRGFDPHSFRGGFPGRHGFPPDREGFDGFDPRRGRHHMYDEADLGGEDIDEMDIDGVDSDEEERSSL